MILGTLTALVAATLALGGCAGENGSATPSETMSASQTASATPSPTPSASASSAPTLAALDGTWCRATDPSTCLTISDGKTADGATVALSEEKDGAPCLTASVTAAGGDAFVVYYCAIGQSPATPVKTEEGSALNLDNAQYERLFSTQAPPYVATWYRQDQLDAATAG